MVKANKKEEKCDCDCGCGSMYKYRGHKMCGGVYGLGFLGAAIYYISQSSGFWMGVFGILKALVWPAMLVYNLFKFLGM
jgi:hypothetical protein